MNKEEKTSTTIGKIMTIVILAFIIASISMSDMLNKTNPNALTQDHQISARPSIIFAKENFTLAAGVVDDNNNAFYMDETVFSFVFTIYSRDASNLSTTTQAEFVMKQCLKEDYREDPAEFDRLSLNGSFCIGNESPKLKIPNRNLCDLFDKLVTMGWLERNSIEENAAYQNSKSTSELFLKESPKNTLSMLTLCMIIQKSFQNLEKILREGHPKNSEVFDAERSNRQ